MKGYIHSLESFGTVDGPGIRFVTFMQGCPLRCLFCHNPDTWDLHAKVPYEWTPQQLMEEVLRYKNYIKSGGVTCTGGEPLLQSEFLLEYYDLCHQYGIHTALDTSGCIFTDMSCRVLDSVDLVMLDVKTADDDLHHQLTGSSRTNNAKTLQYLQSLGRPIWIRHVVVPTLTDDDTRLHLLGEYLSQYSVIQRVEILPYHTMGIHKYEQLGIAYPLKDISPLSDERKKNAISIISQYLDCKII